MTAYLAINEKSAKEELINSLIVKTYTKRWMILILFVMTNALISMQWIQYSVIADVISKYYAVSYHSVNWTALIFSLCYIPLAIPGSFFLDKFGLRNTMLCSTVLACVGAWIKTLSVHEDAFHMVLLGQTILAASAMFIVSMPAAVAATWFGSNEQSTACSVGIVGCGLGVALGFFVPSLVVSDEDNQVGTNLFALLLAIAITTTFLLVAQIIFFEERPLHPPSKSEVQKRNSKIPEVEFFKTIKEFVTNMPFMMHVMTNGIGFGINIAVLTLLNQILSYYYNNASSEAGTIGLIAVLSGMIGTIVCGVILDKYSQYKAQLLVINICCVLVMILFTFTLGCNVYYVYVVSALLGFFWTSIQPIGYETAIELTYPHSEGLAVGFLLTISQFWGVVFTYLYSYLLYSFGCVFTNVSMTVILTIVLFVISCIRFEYHRRNVNFTLIANNEYTPLLH